MSPPLRKTWRPAWCSRRASRFDPEFRWWTLFSAVDWKTGKELSGAIVVGSRPSMLYNVLFGTLGTKAGIFIQVLAGIAIFLGLIELVALYHRRPVDPQHDQVGGRVVRRNAST